MREDVLELTGLGGGHYSDGAHEERHARSRGRRLSVAFEQAARTCVAMHSLERWRYRDQSRSAS